jgi:transcriptional accessory protein Tex/SPT6
MIHYLYHLDYPRWDGAVLATSENPLPCELVLKVGDPSIVFYAHLKKKERKKLRRNKLTLYAKIYSLGEKYGIQGLKALSLSEFQKEVEDPWNMQDFIYAVKEVFTSTVEGDRGLRDVIVQAIVEHPDLLDEEQLRDVVKSCGLCFELMIRFRDRLRGGS